MYWDLLKTPRGISDRMSWLVSTRWLLLAERELALQALLDLNAKQAQDWLQYNLEDRFSVAYPGI